MLKVLVITLFMHEKTRKMKKAFCFDNCSCYNLRKNVSSSDFSFSQVTSVAKKEPRGTFLSLGLWPRLQKTFPRFPFYYFGNLGKTKIRRGQIFPQSSKQIIETKYTVGSNGQETVKKMAALANYVFDASDHF